ncbi:hypothetical protein [Paracoccus sp. (in: a-proteobacteria)]|uniref:hypothetical protein n=1 Tax=Paracoccus sp. TaxID=267 RepID=UPI002AFFAC9C|nr:hypothetical protein [Paracoccus sp. (in: a-proteobacteria)]
MTDDAKLIERLDDTLGGITVPDLMHGDNLAITLCTAYDNPDQDADEETGWTPDAISGMEAVLAAIRAHYAPAFARLTALIAENERLQGGIKARDALLRAGCDLLAGEYDNLKASITMPDGSLSANPLDAWAVEKVAAMEDWIASVKATLYPATPTTEASHGE